MKITTCSCSGLALLLLTPFVRGQAAAGGGVIVSTPPPATMVWITTTNAAGVPSTFQTAYVQTFSAWNGGVSAVPAGTIGLGTITGAVGVTKTVNAKIKRSVQTPVAP